MIIILNYPVMTYRLAKLMVNGFPQAFRNAGRFQLPGVGRQEQLVAI